MAADDKNEINRALLEYYYVTVRGVVGFSDEYQLKESLYD